MILYAPYKVYEEGFGRGKSLGTFTTRSEARDCFEKAKKETKTAVVLQAIDGRTGIIDKVISRYTVDGWDEKVDLYWEEINREERRREWNTSDIIWESPNMYMREFFDD